MYVEMSEDSAPGPDDAPLRWLVFPDGERILEWWNGEYWVPVPEEQWRLEQ